MACKACWNNENGSYVHPHIVVFFNLLWIMMITPFVSVIIIDWIKMGVIKRSTFISHQDLNM